MVGDQAAFQQRLTGARVTGEKQRPLCNGASVLADSPASTDLPHLLRRQVGGAGIQLYLTARLWHCDGLHPYRHDRVLAHFKFLGDLGGYIHHATGNEWTATPMVQPVETARSHRHTPAALRLVLANLSALCKMLKLPIRATRETTAAG